MAQTAKATVGRHADQNVFTFEFHFVLKQAAAAGIDALAAIHVELPFMCRAGDCSGLKVDITVGQQDFLVRTHALKDPKLTSFTMKDDYVIPDAESKESLLELLRWLEKQIKKEV